MKRLFALDGPFFHFLSRMCDLLIVNVLFLLCCVPVVTVGASLAGMTKVTQNIVRDTSDGTVKTFFKAFKENFRQATVLWVLLALFFCSAVCDLVLIDTYLTGTAAQAMRLILGIFAILVVAVACYMLPLLVRYQNTIWAHCRNALLLTVLKLPRTVCIAALTLFPFLLAYFSPLSFLRSVLIWSVIGFSLLSLGCSKLLQPVMDALEKNQDGMSVTGT